MKIKSYISESRPLGQYDKILLKTIESNLNYFNANKRKGILSIEHYVSDGDQWRLLKDGKQLLVDLTLEEVFYAVAAIIHYVKKG